MGQSNLIDEKIASVLNPLGLFSFGYFKIEIEPFAGRSAILIGNHMRDGKHEMFEALKASPEFLDVKRDPMNRWTMRVLSAFADDVGAKALYPFGDKIWPFQQFAKQATGMKPSPLGILIHPEHGLWQAFRAVLVLNGKPVISAPTNLNHPCDTCETKPCLFACPVDAFDGNGLNVPKCFDHLKSKNDPQCSSLGCQARGACPVGIPYSDEQIRFHMKAYGGG